MDSTNPNIFSHFWTFSIKWVYVINWFSPEYIFKCFFKLTDTTKALGHWLQEFFFHHNMFLSVFLNYKLRIKSIDIDCKEMFFHQSVFLSVSTNSCFVRKSYYIDCKEIDIHLSVFLNVFSNYLPIASQNHISGSITG